MNRFLSSQPLVQDFGLGLVRIFIGAFLIYHGREVFDTVAMNKYLEWDMFKNSSGKTMVYAGKASEFISGILLVLGLFTRIAALLVIGTLGYISFFLGNGEIWMDAQHPFLFVLFGVVFLFVGGGKLSLDNLIFKK
ncbi:MAG: DoxX family protein [Bacteroidetes bacterium]|jgi:putative oxidoreductase|nr:MAG: DoxX family protein [Bacteroidota bacterium]